MGSIDSAAADIRPAVLLAPLPPQAMSHLVSGDLCAASAVAGVPLTDFFLTPDALWVWNLRLEQIENDPESAAWVAWLALDGASNRLVGYTGFHGPPDANGMVEVGYSVLPELRRRGYATAILGALLSSASDVPEVRVVRATISPQNTASLAVIAKFPFVEVGEQWDERDGLEIIYEMSIR